MPVHNARTADEFKERISQGLVVVDCYATWCGPCKMIAPKLVALSEQFPQIQFVKLDVDDLGDVSQELGVTAMPSFFFFKDGEQVDSLVGANPAQLTQKVSELAEKA